MIENNKNNKAIQAIQDLIIEARSMASHNVASNDLVEFLDHLEYFPALVVEDNDRTEMFEDYLREVCRNNDCIHVFNRYKMR